MVASIRGPVSRSPRKSQAKKATQIGMVNSSAKTDASGKNTTPMVQKYWAVKCTILRMKCRRSIFISRTSGKSLRARTRMMMSPTSARKNSTCRMEREAASSREPIDMPIKEIMLSAIQTSPCAKPAPSPDANTDTILFMNSLFLACHRYDKPVIRQAGSNSYSNFRWNVA